MIIEHSLAFIVISPITAALIIRLMFKNKYYEAIRTTVTFLGLLIPVIFLLLASPGDVIVYEMGGWERPFGISLILDGLSRTMALITGVVTLAVYVYYSDLLEQDPTADDYHFLYLFMTAGLYGVFLTGDLVNRFIFFEISILTTYVLLTFIGTKESLRASFRYFMLGSIASLMFLTGIGLTYFFTGYLDFGYLSGAVEQLPLHIRNIIFVFFLVAVGVKLAIIPFHTWLADAYVHAPTTMTAILGGITVKIGGYILLKLYDIGFGTPHIRYMVMILGILTALFAAVISLKYTDLKRILAWLTISHMGVIALMFSIWTPESLSAGLLYFINHSFYIVLLFLVVGSFGYIYGTHDIRKLPLMKTNIVLSSTMILGLLALMGLPPLNGFYSRWYLLEVIDSPVIYSVVILTSILTSASVFRIFRLSKVDGVKSDKELSEGMMSSLIVLAGLCSFGGLTTSIYLENVVRPGVLSIFDTAPSFDLMGVELTALYSLHGVIFLLTLPLGYIFLRLFDTVKTERLTLNQTLIKVDISDSVRYIIIILVIYLILVNFL